MRAVSARRVGGSDAIRRARFEALFAEVYEPLQRYVRRRSSPADVDDIVADALLVAWRRIDVVPADAATAWMYGVARNCLSNSRRSVVRAERLALKVADAERVDSQPTVESADVELHAALDALSEVDREIIRLWTWENLRPAEIAIVLGTTANAASIRLHRAKKSLAEFLAEQRKTSSAGGHPLREHREEER